MFLFLFLKNSIVNVFIYLATLNVLIGKYLNLHIQGGLDVSDF